MKETDPKSDVSKEKNDGQTDADPTEAMAASEELRHSELSGDLTGEGSLDASDTDEDEDEGLGDGNIGRSEDDPFKK